MEGPADSSSRVPPSSSAPEPLWRRAGWQRAVLGAGVVAAAGGGILVGVARASGSAAGTFGHQFGLALVGIGVVLSAASLGAYVLGPGLRGPLAAARGFGSHRLVLASTLLVVLVSNLGPILLSLARPGERLCSVPGFLTAALSVQAALFGVTYVRFLRPGVITTADLGLRLDRLGRDIGVGVLVGMLVLVASAAIQALLARLGVQQTQMRDFACIRDFPPLGFAAIVLAGGVAAPIAEELFFRGFIFRSYLHTKGPVIAYLLSSAMFATLHLNAPALLPILTLALVLCFAYHATGSIVPGIVGHALNNSMAFAILYTTNLSG